MQGDITLSSSEKDQLVNLKRQTKIPNWNTLCRWALLLSLGEKTRPPLIEIRTDSDLTMKWRVFAGTYSDVLLALLKYRSMRES